MNRTIALLCLILTACAHRTGYYNARDCHKVESNAGAIQWKCMNDEKRRDYINVYIDHSPPHDVVREPGDIVLERRTGRRGTIDYRDATMAALGDENAMLIVPIYWGGWKWGAIVWTYHG